MSYQVTPDEFESMRLMGFSQEQVRDICIRLMESKKDTDDFKEARKVVETVHNTYQANKPKPKVVIKKQGSFNIGSYKYKSSKK